MGMGGIHMCQDCKGTKNVPLGFYAGFTHGIGANPQLEPCRRCSSNGHMPGWARAVTTAIVAAVAAYRLAGGN